MFSDVGGRVSQHPGRPVSTNLHKRHRRGFECLIKQNLTRNLIPIAGLTFSEERVESNAADDAMPIINIADIMANAPFEELLVLVEDEDES